MTKEYLLSILSERPVKSKYIESMHNVKGSTIRQLVHQLRIDGHHVASSYKGYWIEPDPQVYVKAINSNILPRIKSLSELKRVIDDKIEKEFNLNLPLPELTKQV
jgi:hypothetical protein